MGLVDYSDDDSSASESETPATTSSAKASSQPSSKKPFQKVVDRSNPGKILINLPQITPEKDSPGDEPPTKRAKTTGGGKFSNFNSFLPAPKNANKSTSNTTASSSSRQRVGVNLKTSAAPGFDREGGLEGGFLGGESSVGGGIDFAGLNNGPETTSHPTPSIPEDQKSAEEVKLVGKPLMFKPLSVARGQNNRKKNKQPLGPSTGKPGKPGEGHDKSQSGDAAPAAAPAPAKKVSLFSIPTEDPVDTWATNTTASTTYEPMFETGMPSQDAVYGAYAPDAASANSALAAAEASSAPSESLDSIADDLQLSASERRELFGRGGRGAGLEAKKVLNFNMDREYQHNEGIRAAGEQQMHNPVRAIQTGKHSLQQLVRNVQNQREALEDSFAKGRTNRREASNKYGW